jgi:hypothetical protein
MNKEINVSTVKMKPGLKNSGAPQISGRIETKMVKSIIPKKGFVKIPAARKGKAM